VPAASFERERGALHDLLRVADATRAEDAGVGVVAHELVAVVVLFALCVGEDERRVDSELVREVDELVGAAAGRGVQVLREEHLGQRSLEARDRAVRRDDHPLRDAGGARRQRPRSALDVDDAHPAASVRVELVVVTEGRDERPVPRGRVDEKLALGCADGLPVEGERDHGRIVSLWRSRRPPH
jgi:hypothetical protein